MKITSLFFVLLAVLFHASSIEAQRKRPAPKPKVLSAREIANTVLPSVVLIITQDENGNPLSQGSGFVYKPGLVVSNLHVFERATNAIVKNVKTGEISKAVEVVGMNAKEDICVIRIANTKFPSLSLGDSNSVQTGDEIYVASNPKGLEGSFTKGIVSGLRTDVGLFQLDAATSSGSSGGAVVNQSGEVIGIVRSSIITGQNLNFAIPIRKLVDLKLNFRHMLLLAGACAYTDRAEERLKGTPRIVTVKILPKDSSQKVTGNIPIVLRIKKYDLDGNNFENIINGSDGKFIVRQILTFDENRLAATVVTESSTIAGDTFHLDERILKKIANRKFSVRFGSPSGPLGEHAYDSAGNRISQKIGGSIVTYEYDTEGRLQQVTLKVNGRIHSVRRSAYKNDRYGNWVERKEFVQYLNEKGIKSPWFEEYTEWREILDYE